MTEAAAGGDRVIVREEERRRRCGHTERCVLYADDPFRDERFARFEAGFCAACRAARQEADRAAGKAARAERAAANAAAAQERNRRAKAEAKVARKAKKAEARARVAAELAGAAAADPLPRGTSVTLYRRPEDGAWVGTMLLEAGAPLHTHAPTAVAALRRLSRAWKRCRAPQPPAAVGNDEAPRREGVL